jgi:NodT family efflux transporter outer membrane factor (OMF) lipoprotein
MIVPALLAVLLLASVSCAPHVRGPDTPVVLPERFTRAGEAPLPEKWWLTFEDPRLNGLVDEALRGSFTLRAAWDRLRQAEAAARAAGAPRWPAVDVTAGASRTRTAGPGGAVAYAGNWSAGVAASYELDLWGRIGATARAAELDTIATQQDLYAAAVSLSGEVAASWYRLVELRGQLGILDAQVRTNTDILEVITARFRKGQVSATDVLQQRQVLESVRGQRAQVESAIGVQQHRLTVLLGRSPGGFAAPEADVLPDLPPLPRTGAPAAWIQRRPDVCAALLRVQAADQRTAAAIADQFPRLTLSVRAETSAARIRDLFDNWLASLAAGLTAPLLDGGQRQAETDRSRAAAAERLHAYGQVVLSGLEEVEDALIQEAKQRELVGSLRKQLDLSRQATEQTRTNYTKGAMDFTRFLTTLLSHQQLERTYLEARGTLVQYRINLYRALGGAWALPEPSPAPQRVTGPL